MAIAGQLSVLFSEWPTIRPEPDAKPVLARYGTGWIASGLLVIRELPPKDSLLDCLGEFMLLSLLDTLGEFVGQTD